MLLQQIDWDFRSDEDAKVEIAAAVKYLLRDATGAARDNIIREIVETVRDVAGGLPPQQKPPAMSGVTYKAYVIDAYQNDADNWRATIRRLDGKKIRVAFPPAVLDETTTSADALTAEKAVEFARKAIDGGAVT